jgi:hypothetical protein
MHRFILLLLFWAIFLDLSGQNLNGKWVGYFTPNTDLGGKYYAYELNLTENAKHELTVIAITRFPNFKSAKAIAKGLFTPATKLVSIEETKFESLQLDPNTQACLMHNYLTYHKNGSHEVLEGTYMAINASNGKDCGGGSVIVEKIQPITSFKTSQKGTRQLDVKQNVQLPTKQNSNKPLALAVNKNASVSKNISTNNSSNIIVESKNNFNAIPIADDEVPENKLEDVATKTNDLQVTPWHLVSRENKLVKKIITHNKAISIDLYDNGTIDNDTINVYDNKQLLVNKKRLSYKAIHIDLNFNNSVTTHEVIIVAHNMGTVPPNTALLVYKDGDARQELFITSTDKMNAKLVIEYQPPSP